MAALTAARYNPGVRSYHESLQGAGKVPQVPMEACRRELVTMLNAGVKAAKP